MPRAAVVERGFHPVAPTAARFLSAPRPTIRGFLMGRHEAACGHPYGQLVCIRPPHLEHPRGHVYVSAAGSHVTDRHGEAS